MRRSFVLILLAACCAVFSCGGAVGEAGSGAGKTPSAAEDDRGFSEYAATHGIASLDHPQGAPEVSADGLRLEALDRTKPVKLDGVLTEWPAPAKATDAVSGTTKSTLKITLQYDDAKLYVGADIADAAFVAGKSHVALDLAVPKPGGAGAYTVYELGFFAGKPGESAGTVRYGQRAIVPGSKIVEAPTDVGYTFEAIVPYAAVPELRSTRVGLHGRAAYVGADGVVATGPGDAQHPAAMAWVPSEPELSMIEQLLAPKGLTKIAPAADIVADLTGDGVRERVAVFEHYLTICGPSYLGGTAFFYRDLVGELVKLEVRDVTGRGRGDVVVRRRQSSGDGVREYVEVLSALASNQEPRTVFGHEVGVRQSDRRIENAVRFSRGEIEVAVEPAVGWDAASYGESIATDIEPILLPWGGVRAQVFRFDGARFTKAREVTQVVRDDRSGPSRTRSARDGTSDDSSGDGATHGRASAGSAAGGRPVEPPTPKVTRGGDLSAQVLEQYRRDRGVPPAIAPRVDLQVHVAGDERAERVLLLGRDIVVLGPGFKDGAGYSFLTLQQFGEAADIEDLSARDLTGDGAADLVVRGVRRVTSAKASVAIEMMFVYEVKDEALTRVFAIETAREQRGKRVQGLVQFVPAPSGKAFDILAAPGRASGWNAKTYPWSDDPTGSDGSVEPLLLPWGGVRTVRYTWNGSQYVRAGG